MLFWIFLAMELINLEKKTYQLQLLRDRMHKEKDTVMKLLKKEPTGSIRIEIDLAMLNGQQKLIIHLHNI